MHDLEFIKGTYDTGFIARFNALMEAKKMNDFINDRKREIKGI